jgi:hypothetical protein
MRYNIVHPGPAAATSCEADLEDTRSGTVMPAKSLGRRGASSRGSDVFAAARRLRGAAAALALVLASCAPSETSPIVFGDIALHPESSLFAILPGRFPRFIGNPDDQLIVVLGDLPCAELPTDCATPAIGDHAILDMAMERRFVVGGYQTGRQSARSFTLFAADGPGARAVNELDVDVLKANPRRFVASYRMHLIGEALDAVVEGDIVAEPCPALVQNREACEALRDR